MSDREIDNLFKSRLDDYARTPSPRAWEKLEQKVNRQKGLWRRYIGIAASLILILSATVFFMNRQSNTSSLAVHTADKNEQPMQDIKGEILADDPPRIREMEKIPLRKEKDSISISKPRVVLASAENDLEEEIPEVKNQLINPGQEKRPMESGDFNQVSMEKVTGLGFTRFSWNEQDQEVHDVQMVEKGISYAAIENNINMRRILIVARDFKTDNNAWAALREAKNNFLTLGNRKYEETE